MLQKADHQVVTHTCGQRHSAPDSFPIRYDLAWLADASAAYHDFAPPGGVEEMTGGLRLRDKGWAVVEMNSPPHLLEGDTAAQDP